MRGNLTRIMVFSLVFSCLTFFLFIDFLMKLKLKLKFFLDMVSNLKQMSLDISSELTNQNSQTERLAKKICVNRNQVEKANRKADILLH